MNDSVKDKLESVESSSKEIEEAVDRIINIYCLDLDTYVDTINACLQEKDDILDEELDDFVLNLSTLIYYVNTGAEQMGIRDDVSKTAYKAAYNSARSMIEKGTVADKNTQAELESLEDHIVNVIYNKSYKLLKAKTESAQELLASCKKVMSRRLAEIEITRQDVRR